MKCQECESSYYPESLSGHKYPIRSGRSGEKLWPYPVETLDHEILRFSVQAIHLYSNDIIAIPRYPEIHGTTSPECFLIPLDLREYCISFVGTVCRKQQEELRSKLLQSPFTNILRGMSLKELALQWVNP